MSGIRLFEPNSGKEEEDAVIETIRSGFWASGAGGVKVKEFEINLKKYLKCKHLIAVNSGTAALHLALSLFDMQVVKLPALSFVSTANACLYNGHVLEFQDIDNLTLNMKSPHCNSESLALPVHFGGMPYEIESPPYFPVVEDCAHAMGSKLKSKFIKCFSFHPVKNLAMPNGGAIALYDDQYLEELKEKRWCGIGDRKGDEYDVKRLGWNYYMNEISAAIGIEQLKKLDKNNKIRYKIAKEYFERLHISAKMPLTPDCSYHLYWILVKNRDKFRAKLMKEGIETGTHYRPIDSFSLYKKADLPITDIISKQIVTLPMHPNLTDQEVDRVIKVANS